MDQTRACSKSSKAKLAWTKKKRSLRNEKLKANRASDTEEQRKERLRIRRENEKIENHEKQRLATLKRLKRGDDNEFKSSGWPWRQKKKEEQDWRMMQLFRKVGNYAYHSNLMF